ncbi:TetR/AcrR family transcriptional regulator [Anaerotalea alkaliphila]|uniref:TetR/AcrR family transcriptional regulator n=1 Tax=Anaerotalea alkaliphila TaxID=2662126 RepID=A0A7X5KL69_9FIRM|nr:TetR/AcrR family transcriptional regulator [Anaerotalea alkaliphila]NDL66394.1 TetR/AcrR family transcriptional regulator [Anaerotalea alkaliphila]
MTEQKNLSTKDRILHSAAGILCREGVGEVTMSKVAHQAELGKSTIYEHFRSKEDLVAQAILFVFQEMVEGLHAQAGGPETPAAERLRNTVVLLLAALSQDQSGLGRLFEHTDVLVLQAVLGEEHQKRILELHKKGIGYTLELLRDHYKERKLQVEVGEFDALCFQRQLFIHCAAFCGKDLVANLYKDQVADPAGYVLGLMQGFLGALEARSGKAR